MSSLLTVHPRNTATNIPKVGDILLSSSGFDASIATWAVVVGVTSKRVKIQEVQTINYDYHNGGMDWTSKPNVDNKIGKVETKAFKDCGNGYRIKRNEYSSYFKHDGRPVSCYNHH